MDLVKIERGVCLSILVCLYGIGFISLFLAGSVNLLFFDTINPISIVSALLFVSIVILSFYDFRFYMFFLVFQIIAIPSAINNFVPGIYSNNISELGASIFSFYTHLDLYLILGIFLGLSKMKYRFAFNSVWVTTIIGVFLTSYIINIFMPFRLFDLLLLTVGNFHLRYFLLVLIFLSIVPVFKFKNELILGLAFSVFFLLIEASFNTKLHHYTRLTSGTLGNNTFGNIISGISVFLLFSFKEQKIYYMRFIYLLTIIACIVIIFLTQNRMSILALIVASLLLIFFKSNKKIISLIVISIIVFFISILYTAFEKKINARYNYIQIFKSLDLTSKNTDDLRDASNASLYTRLKLYRTSIKMIENNFAFGIGQGRWNYYKKMYGFKERVLLDAHNGVLSIISQYGILAIVFLFFIYLFPFVIYLRLRKMPNKNIILYLSLINFTMAICDLSNAGISNHQVYFLMVFISLVVLQYYITNKRTIPAQTSPIPI